MKIYKISKISKISSTPMPNYTIKTDYTDSHDNQQDAILRAVDGDNNLLGSLSFSVYEGIPSVQMLDVFPAYQRKGIATALLKELQNQFPNETIELGMSSGEGSKLLKSINFKYTPNQEYSKLSQELNEVNKRIEELNMTYEKWRLLSKEQQEKARESLSKQADEYHSLYDRQYELINQLNEMKPGKNIII